MATETTHLTDAKRALLEKRLRRDLPAARTRPPRMTPRPPGTPAPLSFGQEQLWRAAQLAAGAPIDTEFITVTMPGPLDVAALERSFDAVIRRHDILRTTISTVDGRPTQVIHPPRTFALPVVDLRSLPRSEREVDAIGLATEQARRAFDLAQGPVLRATLVRKDDATHQLFLVLHHLAFDCFSAYTVFLPELAALYAALAAGRPSPLPELPLQYADYALWQREQVPGKKREEDLLYWRRQLRGSPALALPTDHPRPPTPTFRGAMQAADLPRQLTEGLENVSRREGVTLFMTLVAAFQAVLHRYTGQDDIVLGTETGSRTHPETEPLIGFFLNTLVLRTDLSGNPPFRDLLGRVRQVTLEAYAHGEVPFGHLLTELSPGGDASRPPLFQVMMRLGPRLTPLECGWTVSPVDVDPGASRFDLTLDLYDTAEGLIARLEYNADLFDASTMTRMLEHFRTVLEGIVADPEQRLADLPLAASCETGRVDVPTAGDGARQQRRHAFRAPQTWLHEQLVQIWEELLDRRPIGISDDFFELGGTSVLAVRLMAMMASVLGQPLPTNVLFRGATIEHLAQVIMDDVDPERTSPLVELQPDGGRHRTQDARGARTPVLALQTGGAKRPFFFLHGHWFAPPYYCVSLARGLGPDQPFYALDPYKLDDLPVPPSLETIAAAHLEAVRAIQPDGPYLLGGFCNGGLVAYEMARQLHAQGQAVDLLVLLEPMWLPQTCRRWLRVLHGVVGRGGALVRLSPGQQVVWYTRLRHLLGHLYSYLVPHRRNNPGGTRPPLASFLLSAEAVQKEYESKLEWTVLAYRPPSVYPGKITFFWPAEAFSHIQWWRSVAEATTVEVHILPGTLIWTTEHLHTLAERLRLCLATAHTVAGKGPASGGQATGGAGHAQAPVRGLTAATDRCVRGDQRSGH